MADILVFGKKFQQNLTKVMAKKNKAHTAVSSRAVGKSLPLGFRRPKPIAYIKLFRIRYVSNTLCNRIHYAIMRKKNHNL